MLTTSAYKRKALMRFGVKIRCKAFVNLFTPIEHRCPNCGKTYITTPEKVLASSVPYCPVCTQQHSLRQFHKQDEVSFVELLEELIPSLSCVTYNGNSRLGIFRCRACGAEMHKLPRAVLNGQVACTQCDMPPVKDLAPENSKTLAWLRKRVKTTEILSRESGEIPAIAYKIKRRQYIYVADFLVGNTLVEARSVKNFWQHLAFVVEKAKACVRAGFRFKVLLTLPNGNIRCLPEDWYTRSRPELETLVATRVQTLRILSIDPGTTNAAWAVAEYDKQRGQYTLLASGKLLSTVTDLTIGVAQQIQELTHEIQNLVDVYQVNCLGMERYQARGMKGTTIEAVNIMLGVGIKQCMQNPRVLLFRVIPAAQWKNAWNRVSSLDDYYKQVACVVHQADAVGIGIYCLADWLGVKMDEIMGPRHLTNVLDQIETTNLMK